jgi:hypothetical protein
MRNGRREPYTAIGIKRLPCVRCGGKAVHQWQICADNRLYRPMCLECDIALNRLVLEWIGDPDCEAKMAEIQGGGLRLIITLPDEDHVQNRILLNKPSQTI